MLVHKPTANPTAYIVHTKINFSSGRNMWHSSKYSILTNKSVYLNTKRRHEQKQVHNINCYRYAALQMEAVELNTRPV